MITSVGELVEKGYDVDIVRAMCLVEEIIPDMMLKIIGLDFVEHS